MPPIAIRADLLTRDFPTVRALDRLSLEVPAGTVFGFLGPNGSGKTTTIRLLLGLLEPSSGSAEVLGLDTRRDGDAIRQRTGALLEHAGLYERLAAEANLEFYGRIARLSRSDRRARIRELLTHFGLWERRHEQAGRWSRGMKQKLAVARALLHRPALVFLDEPTAGLDPVAAAALRSDIVGLAAREGVTVFVTTHNLSEAERMCTRVGVVQRGRLLAEGTPRELSRRAGASRLRVVGAGFTPEVVERARRLPIAAEARLDGGEMIVEMHEDASAAPLVRMLVESGIAVEEVHRSRPTLEDAFLELVTEEP
jgi:ABC-2 type transport system ATP-binding protein